MASKNEKEENLLSEGNFRQSVSISPDAESMGYEKGDFMKKKVLALLMAGVLCVASLAACGGNGDTSSGNGGSSAANNSESNQGGGQESSADNQGSQGGESALPDTLENPNLTIVWNMTEEVWNQTISENPNAFDLVWSTKAAFEEKYGGKVTVEGVAWGDQASTVISKVNSGEVCDLAEAHDQNFPVYGAKNIVQDISQYIDLNDDFWYDSVTDAFTYGGVHYAAGAAATPVVIAYNKTLFEQNGVKTPREYFQEGNWTWDTFRQVAMDLTGDTDADGTNDVFGFGWWDGFYVQMLSSNGTTNLNYGADGTISGNFETAAAQETFTFLQNAYVTDKFMMIPDGDNFISAFKGGNLAMTCEYGFNALSVYECDYEVDWAPLPQGPSGEKYDCGGSLTGFAIPITSANPEGAAVFIRMAYELKQANEQSALIEKYGQEDVDLMNELGDHINFAPIGIEKYWDANWTIFQGMINGTPVSTFTQQANEQIAEGAAITLGN